MCFNINFRENPNIKFVDNIIKEYYTKKERGNKIIRNSYKLKYSNCDTSEMKFLKKLMKFKMMLK